MTLLTGDIAPFRDDYLRLEQAASAAYNRFVYAGAAQSDGVRGMLFDRGIAEFAPAYSRLLIEEGRAIGMISCLSAEALGRARMRCAWALGHSGLFADDPELQGRLALAGRALIRPEPADFYLSRIAVDEAVAGRGHARALLAYCFERAAEAGAARIVLEVASDNARAQAFYRAAGFVGLDQRSVVDPSAGRTLRYVHMAKIL